MEQEATEEKALTIGTKIDTALKTRGGLIPHDLDQLWRLAVLMSKSGMMPKGIQSPEAVAVAVQMGLEVGLSPMQAVQNIAVINGRPSIWGDSVLGLVRASGLLEDFDEYFVIDGKRLEPAEVDQHLTSNKLTAICIAKRKDQDQPIERAFSIADAKTANLWGVNVWKTYPKRMLQMRPRSWTLRDGFGDVIKGLRVAEEVIDMVSTNGQSYELGGDATAALNAKIKDDKKEPGKDIYKAEETSEPEKPEGEKEEGEDQIRKLYKGLGDRAFEEFVISHADAIPTMDQVYQDEIKASHYKRAKKRGGLLEDKPYPLDPPKEEVQDPDNKSEEDGGPESKDKADAPTMIPCLLTYDDQPKKDDNGRMATTDCDAVKCESRKICVPYIKDKENTTS